MASSVFFLTSAVMPSACHACACASAFTFGHVCSGVVNGLVPVFSSVQSVVGVFVGSREFVFLIQIGIARSRRKHVRQQVVGIEVFRICLQRLFAKHDRFRVVALHLLGLGLHYERKALEIGVMGNLVIRSSTALILSSGVRA